MENLDSIIDEVIKNYVQDHPNLSRLEYSKAISEKISREYVYQYGCKQVYDR